VELARRLEKELRAFDRRKRPLLGIRTSARRETFVEQLVESMRRIRYVFVIRDRALSALRADPSDPLFDPVKAAIVYEREGDIEESFWMVFMFVYFGKHSHAGWRLARDVYGRLGEGATWTWSQTHSHPGRLRKWLAAYQSILQGSDGIARHFGNHRKHETLSASSPRGTGRVVESYVNWVNTSGSHAQLVREAQQQANFEPRRTFELLYRSMAAVISFGRLARFDYLTMVGKLGLADIEPGSAYLTAATGPLRGARLLFGGHPRAALVPSLLDPWLIELEAALNLGPQGMQALEDALCNWQKSPEHFQSVRT
jgi:Alpha-glutamyl/putrescinyl thymine pyrophosphorylase clade 3